MFSCLAISSTRLGNRFLLRLEPEFSPYPEKALAVYTEEWTEPHLQDSRLPGSLRRSSPDSSLATCSCRHQSHRLNCLLDDRNLGLVRLAVDNLPRFRFPPRQFPL